MDPESNDNLYYQRFGTIPNKYTIRVLGTVNYIELYNYMKSKSDIFYVNSRHAICDNTDNHYYTFIKSHHKIMICNSYDEIIIYYVGEVPTDYIDEFKDRKYSIVNTPENNLSIVINTSNGLTTFSKKLPNTIYNQLNYNVDFLPKHEHILKNLKERKSGLYLFYGLPGTGKSSYIAALTSFVDIGKKFIYLPSTFIGSLDSPDIIKLFLEDDNSIFIIEDAEKLLINRNDNSNSPISALLNLSDGLLGQILNNQIICTFNTDIKNIDPALMRKGRLICAHEFKELTIDRANDLFKYLGNENIKVQSPMVLTDIYNCDSNVYTIDKKKVKIGF